MQVQLRESRKFVLELGYKISTLAAANLRTIPAKLRKACLTTRFFWFPAQAASNIQHSENDYHSPLTY
jgi:hypothetical protein